MPIFYVQLRGCHRLYHLMGLALATLATITVGTSVFLSVTFLSTSHFKIARTHYASGREKDFLKAERGNGSLEPTKEMSSHP